MEIESMYIFYIESWPTLMDEIVLCRHFSRYTYTQDKWDFFLCKALKMNHTKQTQHKANGWSNYHLCQSQKKEKQSITPLLGMRNLNAAMLIIPIFPLQACAEIKKQEKFLGDTQHFGRRSIRPRPQSIVAHSY
jgi:hypothetical protein